MHSPLPLVSAAGAFVSHLLMRYPWMFGMAVLGLMLANMAWEGRQRRIGR